MQAVKFSGLSAREIEFWRSDHQVLAGVSLELAAGECMHVLGPNGSGKTTLLRIIAGLLTPEQGTVRWGGRDIRHERDAWSAGLSYLAHSDGLKPELTARENLAFEVGIRRPVDASELDGALDCVGLAAERNRTAGTMSAGQHRRLAIARVVLAAVPLWILDEPYTNLDAAGAATMSDLIRKHLDAGGAALLAAHQPPSIPNHVPHRLVLA